MQMLSPVSALLASLLILGCGSAPETSVEDGAAIRFALRPIPFSLENGETTRMHAPETMAGGVAVFDSNNDGHLDIYFTNGAEMPSLEKSGAEYSNRLFVNDGTGRFEDVTLEAGVAGTGYDTGVAVGDYDGDGHRDLFIGGVHRNTLYRNCGDGSFEDVTGPAGLTLNNPDPEYGSLWSVGGVWLDYDRDSLLDLFVVNYLQWDPETERNCNDYCHPRFYGGTPNRLYRNQGDGTFADVSDAAGIRPHAGKGMGVGVADFNGDGRLDIFVANDKAYNYLFLATEGGRFEEVAFESGVVLAGNGTYISGMGVDARDVDNDGLTDIAYVALNQETFPLFRNLGDTQFEEVTTRSDLAHLSWDMSGYSPHLADFDNDGWKDLFVSRGHVQSLAAQTGWPVAQHNSVFRNTGAGKFEAFTAAAGFTAAVPQRHRGAAVGDFNRDGRLDVVVVALNAPAEVWLNESPGENHWIELELTGVEGVRDPVGAQVRVVTDAGSQYDHVCHTAGYASSSAGPLHFGLGAEAVVELIEIRWPSGQHQALREVVADQVLRVTEPVRSQSSAAIPRP
jgi:enediyne biosynthesis protein E4